MAFKFFCGKKSMAKLNVETNKQFCKTWHTDDTIGQISKALSQSILNAAAEAFKLFLRVVDIEVILLLEECWSTLWNITGMLPCGYHLPCGYNVVTMICGYHVVTIWLPCGYHVVTMWLPCGYHDMWLPCGYHVEHYR